MNTKPVSGSSNIKKPVKSGYREEANKENKFSQKPIKSVSSASSTSLPKLKGEWATRSLNSTSSAPAPVSRPLDEREVNIPQKQFIDKQPSKNSAEQKLKLEQRKATQLKKPELKLEQKTEPAKTPINFVDLLREPISSKIDADLEYFNSLEKHPKIQNLCRDKKTGREYTYTKANDEKNFKQQVKLFDVYRKQGLFIPEHKILNIAEGLYVLLVQYVTVQKISEYLMTASNDQVKNVHLQLRKAFAADVLFMNLDVLQGDLDSAYRINDKGVICRISARSLNSFHPDVAYPTEIWDMRDINKNPYTSPIWSKLDIVEIAKQIINLAKSSDDFFCELSKEQKAIALKRWNNCLIIANKTMSMSKDRWLVGYIEKLNYHMVCLKKAGCEQRLPKSLYPDPTKGDPACRLRSPNGILFEELRHKNSIVETILMPYVAKNGGNYQIIIDWMVGHESSGWSIMSQVLMHFLTLHRAAPKSGYFWKEGVAAAKNYYFQRASQEGAGNLLNGQTIIENSFIILHAFTQGILGRVAFPNNILRENEEGSVIFLRSESRHVMLNYTCDYENNIDMQMGPYSSGSVVANPPLVHGAEVTRRIIPHHRVFALYFMLRTLAESNRGAFSNDFQNEFTAILGGINCDYIDTLKK